MKGITSWIKSKLVKPEGLKAMEFVLTNNVFDKVAWKPHERIIEKVLQKKPLVESEKRRFRKLLRILQKGKGYTPETRASIDKELPSLIERVCDGKATEKDYADVIDLKRFLAYLKEEERMRFLEARKLV
jgi:hypothetical protein